MTDEDKPEEKLEDIPEKERMSRYEISSLFVFFIVLIPVFLVLLSVSVPKEITDQITYTIPIFEITWNLEKNMHLVFLVLYAGILGGLIHGLSSLSHYAKDKNLGKRFTYWYISRPFLGAGFALAIYFALRGGIIADDGIDILNPYGIAAMSVIVGLASKKVGDKLRDVFNTLLK